MQTRKHYQTSDIKWFCQDRDWNETQNTGKEKYIEYIYIT